MTVSTLPDGIGDSKTITFDSEAMRETLGDALAERVLSGAELTKHEADALASGLVRWAESRNCTHFCHYFSPLTPEPASKILTIRIPSSDNARGSVILDGSQLVSETDGSSFPTGGLRSTMEARGITRVDHTSMPYIKQTSVGRTLILPTTFESHRGHSLDLRVPLARASTGLTSVLNRLGNLLNLTQSASVNFGPEQEYFLCPSELVQQRPDIRVLGRTLFGALPYSQNHHYFKELPLKLTPFFSELDASLKQHGLPVTCHHSEVAPMQFELAINHASSEIASNWNMVIKQILCEIAEKHGYHCLLHPKPFAGCNGSGLHHNFSVSVGGYNIFRLPRSDSTPVEIALFFIGIAIMVAGVDEHAGLIRSSAATAANDLRLGGAEAPPGIISVYLGEQLTRLMESLSGLDDEGLRRLLSGETFVAAFRASGNPSSMGGDRNRTSPCAFVGGNRFEFRSPSSADAVQHVSAVLSTVMGDSLSSLIGNVENMLKTEDSFNRDKTCITLIREAARLFSKHRRIVFNGDAYSSDWKVEADRRGLPDFESTVDALEALREQKTLDLYTRTGVLSNEEVLARLRIQLRAFTTEVSNEASILLDMIHRFVLSDGASYLGHIPRQMRIWSQLVDALGRVEAVVEEIEQLNAEQKTLDFETDSLDDCFAAAREALELREVLVKAGKYVTEVERLVGKSFWSLPTYDDLLKV